LIFRLFFVILSQFGSFFSPLYSCSTLFLCLYASPCSCRFPSTKQSPRRAPLPFSRPSLLPYDYFSLLLECLYLSYATYTPLLLPAPCLISPLPPLLPSSTSFTLSPSYFLPLSLTFRSCSLYPFACILTNTHFVLNECSANMAGERPNVQAWITSWGTSASFMRSWCLRVSMDT
jgi:hypothetical protein